MTDKNLVVLTEDEGAALRAEFEQAAKPEDKIAALEARVEELERAAKPKPEPSREEQERATAEWIDKMHQMREGRMSLAMPPSVVRYFADGDDRLVKEIALRDARAPSTPATIPQSQQPSREEPEKSSTPGYSDPCPLRPPEGVNYADRLMDEQDRRDRAELAQRLGALKR